MPVTSKEIEALKIVANGNETLSRLELERLSRLDLIEPCAAGVCLSVRGKEIVFKSK